MAEIRWWLAAGLGRKRTPSMSIENNQFSLVSPQQRGYAVSR